MTDCTQETFHFPPMKRRKIESKFTGGDITSDGGVMLLHEIDRRINLVQELSGVIPDPRHPDLKQKELEHNIPVRYTGEDHHGRAVPLTS